MPDREEPMGRTPFHWNRVSDDAGCEGFRFGLVSDRSDPPFFHPQRWLGYLATVLLLYGTGSILLGRIKKEKEVYKSSEFADWTFPVLLFATALSGIILHTLRLLGFEVGTCYTYAIHIMIATPMLVIEMPFGKWTHMIYRPLAVSLQPHKREDARNRNGPPRRFLEHATA